mgnify:CR=1 FL=1
MRHNKSRAMTIKMVKEYEPLVSKGTIYNRIYRKGTPFRNDTRVTLTVNGQPAIEIARENGIPDAIFYNRVYAKHWTAERSANTPVRSYKKK